jgi:hypothetical protein
MGHPKRPRDFAQRAFQIVQESTGQIPKPADPDAAKDPAAVARGRRGGVKGGPARAAALSARKRTTIAKQGATARWRKS